MTRTCRRVLKAACSAITLVLLLAAPSLLSAQDVPKESPEVKKLNERVEVLEQTIQELKDQLASMNEAKKTAKVDIVEATYKPPPAVYKPDTTSTVAQPTRVDPAGSVKPDEDRGDTTFQVYGFVMLDMGYDFKSNHPDWYDVIRPTKLPSFGGEFNPEGKYYMGVRQSRFGVKYNTPTKYGELKTIFEWELFGTGVDAGQTTFRLRHAYGELGKFGVGQYWTVFGDVDAFPNTYEYWGPNGLVWFRNVQARYMPLKGRNSVTIALEKPGAASDNGIYANRIELQGVKPRLAWPDLTGNFRMERDWGHLQFSGVLRSLRWVDTNDDEFDLGGSAIGYGGSVSAIINFGKKDVGRFQLTAGQGIQNYMNDAPTDVGAETNIGDPRRPVVGQALPMWAGSWFLDHTWNDRFATSAGYSILSIDNTNAQAANAYHRGHYGLVNLVWSPVSKVNVASEFQWGRRENFADGFGVNDFRVQFSIKYAFSKLWKYNE